MRLHVSIFLGFLLLVTESISLECPTCACPPSYDPVCAFNNVSRRYRGFSSLCEMDCINDCFSNRFQLAFKGRCGHKKIANGRRKPKFNVDKEQLIYDATERTFDPRR